MSRQVFKNPSDYASKYEETYNVKSQKRPSATGRKTNKPSKIGFVFR